MSDPLHRIEDATDDRTAPEHARKYAHEDDVRGDVREAIREQREEINQSWAGPGLGPMSDGQWKGFVLGSLLGGLLGALVLLPFGLIEWGGGLAVGWRLLVAGLAGALGGGTAGALYFGGRVPELEGETVDAAGRPDLGSSPRDAATDERGRSHSGRSSAR
ncbi:MAG: hypothetical protein KDB10_20035 [Acidimicrobiales bacterium]|nr:hypothetical protein [Acidimicrobiales bacterium]